jgi:taurine--2-oxoglutarate transaminase
MTYTHENMILIAPPLIISAEQLAEEMAKLDEALAFVDDNFITPVCTASNKHGG